MDLAQPATARKATVRVLVGRVLSGAVVVLLLADAAGKLFATRTMIDTTPAALQLPDDVGLYRALGGILAACVALHLWQRTALLGAVLVTGFLGGAIAVNLRAGMPLATNTLVGLYFGILMWVGFYLRDARLRVALS